MVVGAVVALVVVAAIVALGIYATNAIERGWQNR
jgi:hypothetical protein